MKDWKTILTFGLTGAISLLGLIVAVPLAWFAIILAPVALLALLPLGLLGYAAIRLYGQANPSQAKAVRRILIVDDDSRFAELLGICLESLGMEIEIVSQARKAYLQMARDQYDLVILDERMPELTGSAILKRLNLRSRLLHENRENPVPVVFCSSGDCTSFVRSSWGSYRVVDAVRKENLSTIVEHVKRQAQFVA